MTLSELKRKFMSRPTVAPPTKAYVFVSEDSADNWIECNYFGKNNHAYELCFVIESDMTVEYSLKEKWCKAEVEQFYAVEPDVIVVVVEPYDGGES